MATKTQQTTQVKPGSAQRPAMKQAAAAVEKAKANPALDERKKKATTEVAVRKEHAVSADLATSFEEDANDGQQQLDADSVAIPFLTVLQKNSPQCDPDQGDYMPDAKPGMLYNTVSRELYDGKEGVKFVLCAFKRTFLQWAAREVGGGFRGEHTPEAVVKMRDQGILVDMENRLYVADDNGNVNPKKNDKVADTRVNYILILDENTGAAQQAVLSLSSTQIKKSKQLNSLWVNQKLDRADGSKYTPACYAHVFSVTTIPESNEKGNWSGVKFEREGLLGDTQTYQLARSFAKLVGAGNATVNYDAARGAGDDEAGGEEGGQGQRGRF